MNEKEVWVVNDTDNGIFGVFTNKKNLYEKLEWRRQHFVKDFNGNCDCIIETADKKYKLSYPNVVRVSKDKLWFGVTFFIKGENGYYENYMDVFNHILNR